LKFANFVKIAVFSAIIVFFSGCGINEHVGRVWPEGEPSYEEMVQAYENVRIKRSKSARVLSDIQKFEKELLSQSDSVVASWGEKKKTTQIWMTMVAFDDEQFSAWRKYFFTVNENPWMWGLKYPKLWFSTQVVVDKDILEEPYSNKNQKYIAIIESVLENVRDDFAEVRDDSRVLNVGGMLTNQLLERLLYVLRESPALAARLGDEKGMPFDHLTLGKSWAGMTLDADIVEIKISSGKSLDKIDKLLTDE